MWAGDTGGEFSINVAGGQRDGLVEDRNVDAEAVQPSFVNLCGRGPRNDVATCYRRNLEVMVGDRGWWWRGRGGRAVSSIQGHV